MSATDPTATADATASDTDTGTDTGTGTGSGVGLRTSDIVLGDHSLHVHEVGDPSSPTVLWLHGSGPGVSALSNWERLITTMPAYHHIAPDILGFGESSHPDPAPLGMKAYTKLRAEVLLALLDHLTLERVHLVGNSMGGMITLELIGMAPSRADRIVLMGSGGSPVPPTAELGQMVGYYQNPGLDSMRALLQNFVYDTATFGGKLEEIALDRVQKAGRPDVERSHLATFNFTGGAVKFEPEDLAKIDNQVLVVHGREDKLIPPEAAVYLSTHLPNAQLHVLPQAGHWVQIEQVARFRALAELFFGEQP